MLYKNKISSIVFTGLVILCSFSKAEVSRSISSEPQVTRPIYISDYLLLYPEAEVRNQQEVLNIKIDGTAKEFELLNETLTVPEQFDLYGSQEVIPKEANLSTCHDVVCILKEIFQNEEAAYRVLNIYARSGYVISQRNTFFRWTIDGIRNVESALILLPMKFYNLEKLKYFRLGSVGTPYNRSWDFCGNGSATFSDITKSISECSIDSVYAVVHEMGHAWHHSGNWNIVEGYSKISGWVKWNIHSGSASFISDYASRNYEEDFAEGFAHYILHPNKLKKIKPALYEYLKTYVFDGKEYQEFSQ